MRGLKQLKVTLIGINIASHLLQMRGLKQKQEEQKQDQSRSHLLQMRGLKLDRKGYRTRRQEVASFTDAWIETLVFKQDEGEGISRIFYRCVD